MLHHVASLRTVIQHLIRYVQPMYIHMYISICRIKLTAYAYGEECL